MSGNNILEIKDLHARLGGGGREILQGVDLTIKAGEVHAIMGPNGAGKSTLGYVLSGHPGYEVTGGEVSFDGQDLLGLSADARARAGLFLAFQYPIELPGVNVAQFLRQAVAARREVGAAAFLKEAKEVLKNLGMESDFLQRFVNVGFSGGEKKRFEVVQMALLQPNLAILDETDSGLDVDAMRIVANSVNELRNNNRSFLIITHYERLLEMIKPDFVHVMSAGRVVRSGWADLAQDIEKQGYNWLTEGA
jgi:Fe-S cluster assembly ATP-binding protein